MHLLQTLRNITEYDQPGDVPAAGPFAEEPRGGKGRLSSLNTNKLRARKDNIGGWCGERWVRGSTWASTLLKKKNIKSKCYYHKAALHITQMGL